MNDYQVLLGMITLWYMVSMFMTIRVFERMSCDELLKNYDSKSFKSSLMYVVIMYSGCLFLGAFGIVSISILLIMFSIPTLLLSVSIYIRYLVRRCMACRGGEDEG